MIYQELALYLPKNIIFGSLISKNLHKLPRMLNQHGCPMLPQFLDLAVAKSLQSTRTVTDAADYADVLTTTG